MSLFKQIALVVSLIFKPWAENGNSANSSTKLCESRIQNTSDMTMVDDSTGFSGFINVNQNYGY